jgi:hypothetical protein
MATNDSTYLENRINRIRTLTDDRQGTAQFFEAASLAQSVLHDTVGGSHPLAAALQHALESADWKRALAASRALLSMYDGGDLKSPRLMIAREIEGDILDIAQSQVQAAEGNTDPAGRQLQLSIAAFLAGASLEDALRRLCEAHGIAYDTQRTSLSKLQTALFQPSKQIEVISVSENKQITAWGDTRNKADHGRFGEITHSEVLAMIFGTRAFIEKHLP